MPGVDGFYIVLVMINVYSVSGNVPTDIARSAVIDLKARIEAVGKIPQKVRQAGIVVHINVDALIFPGDVLNGP